MAKFVKGQSGNPVGKKPGCKDKRTELQELLKPHAPQLIQKAVNMALGGDAAALKLCIDRLIPPQRAQRAPVTVAVKGNLAEKAGQIFKAATAGKIGSDIATELIGLITAQVRIIETAELVARLEALEAKIADNNRERQEL